jgi:16S rRNA (guanine527-N7)-methyltransferase
VTSRAFRDRLLRRLGRAGVASPPREALDLLDSYFQLLTRWNQKINLTGLPLDPPSDDALDRLLVEPIAAARHLSRSHTSWIDLGSGGGSPAIPLRIVGIDAALTMVESKARKAAFLREVVRTLGLTNTNVENERAEAVAARLPRSVQLVTVRAVRLDSRFALLAAQLLQDDGRLAIFCPSPLRSAPARFEHVQTNRLMDGKPSYLGLYRPLFHVEQTR